MAHEGEGDTAEVGTTSEAADHDIRILASHLHLLLSLEADDGLMESYVIEHRAQGVFTVWSGRGELYSLRDGCSQ